MSTFVISGSWVQRTSENLFILWTNHPLPFCPYSLFTQCQPFPLLLAKCLIFYWLTYSHAQNVTFSLSYRMLRISGSSGPRSTCSSFEPSILEPCYFRFMLKDSWITKAKHALAPDDFVKMSKKYVFRTIISTFDAPFILFFLYFINLKI